MRHNRDARLIVRAMRSWFAARGAFNLENAITVRGDFFAASVELRWSGHDAMHKRNAPGAAMQQRRMNTRVQGFALLDESLRRVGGAAAILLKTL